MFVATGSVVDSSVLATVVVAAEAVVLVAEVVVNSGRAGVAVLVIALLVNVDVARVVWILFVALVELVELVAKVVVVGEGVDFVLEVGDGAPSESGLGGPSLSSLSSSRMKMRRESALSFPRRYSRFMVPGNTIK